MKTKIIRLLIVFLSIATYAQNREQFTHYMYNTVIVNPAYAGSKPAMSVFALHRNQWVGLDGAPVTNSFSLNTPIGGSNIGLGLSVVNDKIGVSDENDISVDFSYTIPININYKLAFGLKGGVNILNADFTKLTQQPGDPVFHNNIDNQFSPNIGVGFYIHSDKSYLGLSAPYLIKTDHYSEESARSTIVTSKINYLLIAGHVFDMSSEVKFKPSLLTKYAPGTPLQVDVSANFLINQKFVAGVAYRWSAAMSGMVGFQINNSWLIGYGYDFDTTSLGKYNSGSHEIFLRYELFTKPNKIISPRFF
ncbi:type IX secretion system membrane protein PorP/SprF [Flavobacterium amniphilum]|uniref:PorP/SprF family type IX secretion system membrane protein n=1 Tax=Flavobacterium amniphilum TaxID=1834035 RepID=UPI00202ABB6B|nr:type IX secretion system membrane protein PorP/SprF [Flavobacterium amniphilum]MCL9805713.1 type IX secretion system membrane protein PorP/SprF [Flavobacterium amniphilum]